MNLNKNFWTKKYKTDTIDWDVGEITTPLKTYVDQLKDKNVKILIPGTGNSYEAAYLYKNGFKNVFVIDLVKKPLDNLASRIPNFPKEHLLQGDFFKLNQKFDLIIEQTFFCALNPNLRTDYVSKMYDILNTEGKIVGLYFQFPLTKDGPPFGGSKKEYLKLFATKFKINTLENCHNSIKPRIQKELFAIFEKN
ncbi:MAG: TPMT family class I SAM-dependent methyltransferase [Flavobacteriaceae bacterium]|nr:TPMT family class I SAM-dependent methyltransferase [Flavobacteriaceae bacterium]